MSAREIKFRGWDEQRRVMHMAFQFIKTGDAGNDWILFVSDRQPIGGKVEWDKNPHFSQQFKVMQFTGLKDKNGKEIYEGDILTAAHYPFQDGGEPNYHAVVDFGTDAMFLAVKVCVNPARRGISSGIAEPLAEIEDWEIIGNIYEAPNLLPPEPQP